MLGEQQHLFEISLSMYFCERDQAGPFFGPARLKLKNKLWDGREGFV